MRWEQKGFVSKFDVRAEDLVSHVRAEVSAIDKLFSGNRCATWWRVLGRGRARHAERSPLALQGRPRFFDEAQQRVKEIQNHTVTMTVSAEMPIFIGDVEYLTSAIALMLNNACKFSEPGTPITMGASVTNQEVTLWVKDQGRGIPKPEQEHIWESFYQIDRATNEDQGAGAGLAIVKGIATLHGGKVGLESEVGQGSTFKVMLPVVLEAVTID